MEGVEDIPGTALHEGIDWRWEIVPRVPRRARRDAARARRRRPGAALRAARLRARRARPRRSTLSDDEIAEMARLTDEALRAGAVGFSTSRTILHRSKHGLVPGTHSTPEELLAHRPRARRRRPRRLRDGRPTCRARSPICRGCASSAAHDRPRHHLRAGADADAAGRVARHAGAHRRARRRRAAHRAAGAVPPDRHAVRPAELAAPVHHAPDLSRTSSPSCRSPSASRACAIRRCARALLAEEPPHRRTRSRAS